MVPFLKELILIPLTLPPRPWLRLTPDLQIVRQGLPGRTAIVGGFRAEVRF